MNDELHRYMKRVAVGRVQALDVAEFVREHVDGAGLPVIVTDGVRSWPASSKWSFEYFGDVYGSDIVIPAIGRGLGRLTKLGAFIEWLDSPARELEGFCVDMSTSLPVPHPPSHEKTPYLQAWRAFRRHPELGLDILPPAYFVEDWVLRMRSELIEAIEHASGREFWSIYVGPGDTLSKLHIDFWHTHACLSQFAGRKAAVLFSPNDSEFLYHGQVDPEKPDFVCFPLLQHATAYECILEPGETLFVPADWWHCVRALDKSITLSHNFFNGSNIAQFMQELSAADPELANAVGPIMETGRQPRVVPVPG
jgi:histone arginine demethylase JMJD6